MNSLRRSYGSFLSSAIVVMVTIWVIGMIVGPQVIMLEKSLWYKAQSGDAATLSVKIDRLYNEIDQLKYDKSDLEIQETSIQRLAQINKISIKIDDTTKIIHDLESQETKPVKVYSLRNYTLMGASHFFIFVKTIVAAVAVTIIAFLVCYPIAFIVAKLATPGKAALIMIFLIIPYSINELLRIFAWLMILDNNGVANYLLGLLGFDPIPFLGSGSGVFIAMVYAYILFMVFPIYNTIETLDTSQIEAARDLGAPAWQVHRKIVIPHAKPGIAVGCIMTFMLSAGSFAVPNIMTRGIAEPWFTQLIYNKFFESSNWNAGSAYAFTLVTACIVFIFLVMRLFKVSMREIAK